MSDLIERAKAIADDAMGMEPEDRRTVVELIGRIAKLEEDNAMLNALVFKTVEERDALRETSNG